MKKYDLEHIRNFSIVAHIDHGKSTLADRILEQTGAIEKRELKEQLLDDMELERRRGITIKLNAVSLNYHADNGEDYLFNLIDTPGHVDFTYEVSRSLAACEGAILVVDATQGVEAQTLANAYLAIANDLEILPVINKMDLPSADLDRTKEDMLTTLGIDPDDSIPISAKTGLNIHEVLEGVVRKLPHPEGDDSKPLQALVFDSKFDPYRGVIILFRVKQGKIKVGDTIELMSNSKQYLVTELGIRTPKEVKVDELAVGEVGYLAAQIKNIKDVKVGDTITLASNKALLPLPGYRKLNPMVYSGVYPSDNDDFEALRDALDKLSLNDAALVFEPETSQALGSGFRCGFLGLLHMDVIQERLENEYDIDLVCTAPSVVYKINMNDGSQIILENPCEFPDPTIIKSSEEPYVKATIMTPKDYIGALMTLCQDRRGTYVDMVYVDDNRVELIYEMPLTEIIFNFFDKLKSLTAGYASFDYELIGYKESRLVRMDILLNGEIVDALTMIIFKDSAYQRARVIVDKLKEVIPRQQFEIPVQAVIGGKIIARSTVKAVRKDVLAKCYGGDISRKKKLLEKQKKGKKRMKEFGRVQVPQEAFIALLSIDD
ncbi:MAG: translation elongation factor 4 [Bacilli bacterium]|nr:translation elongation factor 4 [Bacilli bacterium]MDY4156523.1 translation elongation factor 4 [Bacilli bacterium]MDY4724030.1 translation elongation factor 4 [Bacilli bacterium]MDY4828121.1 translation elongation factor 4 [Bacilli bacterium]MDY5248875.1 translation elongation factor 4 [Bacilli bacterium]